MRSRVLHPRGVLLVAMACFVALALTAVLETAVALDTALREALLALASPPLVALMRVVNLGGDKLVLAPATLLLFVAFPRARDRWWVWIGLMVAAPAVEGLLKEVIGRPRPEGLGFGFPSGHATAAAAFFGAVVYLAGSLRSRCACLTVRALALVLLVLVALARVILRAHWPSDALGGVALGLTLAATAALLASAPRVQMNLRG
ncbi:MAG: phosphatase PAP2 family protein [Candidatus Rokubacteria bacterium]|nr:phosphatase PAP2 family protein [Candidatus Rokubacteria bacterium]MBI4592929.1 phosphatase PAP2 family protein [Candidatus Rokubacteria bacterium]